MRNSVALASALALSFLGTSAYAAAAGVAIDFRRRETSRGSATADRFTSR